jgi:hypothetical protein
MLTKTSWQQENNREEFIINMVIPTWFMEGYKRRPEDRELDSYERGLDSYWRRINQQQGN